MKSMTLAHITDLHLDDFTVKDAGVDSRQHALRILDAAGARGIDHLVLTGDIGIPESLGWLFDAIDARDLNALVTLGNHDIAADFQNFAAVSRFIGPDGLNYSLVMGGVLCIFLDSSHAYINDGQLCWLENELKKAEGNVAVFTHYPVLDCGGTAMDRLYPLKNREQVRQVLAESRSVVSIFCGHYHTTHEQRAGNMSQFVTPAALVQLKQDGDKIEIASRNYGYRLISLSPKEIATEAVLFSG